MNLMSMPTKARNFSAASALLMVIECDSLAVVYICPRSVILETVLPSFLPLDIILLLVFQERFSFPEIRGVFVLADVDGALVEYFQHVVKRNRGSRGVFRRIPVKG